MVHSNVPLVYGLSSLYGWSSRRDTGHQLYGVGCLIKVMKVMFLLESPVEFFLRRPSRGDINSEQELLEIYEAIVVAVKSSEHMGTEILSLPSRETLAVDLHEQGGRQLSIWAVLHEPLVPLGDGGLIIPGVQD